MTSGLTSRRSQPPSPAAFVFRKPRVGGGSAFFVRPKRATRFSEVAFAAEILVFRIVAGAKVAENSGIRFWSHKFAKLDLSYDIFAA